MVGGSIGKVLLIFKHMGLAAYILPELSFAIKPSFYSRLFLNTGPIAETS
jgi:hypothetical protein